MIEDNGAILKFDTRASPFDAIITNHVRNYVAAKARGSLPLTDLSQLHRSIAKPEVSEVYSAIYDLFLTDKFTAVYDRLCGEIISAKFAGKAAFQKIPSVRIQMPGQMSANYHADEWYGHGHDVQNFWLPLVPVSGTNSMLVSDEITSLRITQAIRDRQMSVVEMNELARPVCMPLNMSFGEIYYFNSHIIHGTELNTTAKTRVSFDFRMLRDGDDRGSKDESFFLRPGERTKVSTASTIGAVYIGKNDQSTRIISQKYQALLCIRYATENNISAQPADTELSGFDHHPALWNLLSGTRAGSFSQLIIFSALLLPGEQTERKKLAAAFKAQKITVHFVSEDIVARPESAAEMIETAYQRSTSLAVPGA
jgi:sporadic carbohydrate cluster protein (TIGR04323 family)